MASARHQPAVLKPAPSAARFLAFQLRPGGDPAPVLKSLAKGRHDPANVVGVGPALAERLGRTIPGLRAFPTDLPLFPAKQGALWVFLGQPRPADAFDAAQALWAQVRGAFDLMEEVPAFNYRGHDLSGYEDGTENPKGKNALAAALIAGQGKGLDGGSFVAAQRWVHDLDAIAAMEERSRDDAIGRRRKSNFELADAPPSAHVKRTAQESFEPPAFIVRRSMPYGGIGENGLYFVAYGATLDAFERQLRRMSGAEDGVVDAVTTMSRAVSGGYYFCPPLHAGRLDLRALLG